MLNGSHKRNRPDPQAAPMPVDRFLLPSDGCHSQRAALGLGSTPTDQNQRVREPTVSQTHQVINQPPPRAGGNAFRDDPMLLAKIPPKGCTVQRVHWDPCQVSGCSCGDKDLA